MTLPFRKEVINDNILDIWSIKYPHFVGYLNKVGEIIEFDYPLTFGHGATNGLTDKYLGIFKKYYNYLNVGFCEKVTNRKMLLDISRMLEFSLKDLKYNQENNYTINLFDILEVELLSFFRNCFLGDNLEYAINSNIKIEKNESSLLMLLKEILVSYLGYHAIERVPRMIYDSKLHRYVPYQFNEFFALDSDNRLKDEIISIKKLVAKDELVRYYR